MAPRAPSPLIWGVQGQALMGLFHGLGASQFQGDLCAAASMVGLVKLGLAPFDPEELPTQIRR